MAHVHLDTSVPQEQFRRFKMFVLLAVIAVQVPLSPLLALLRNIARLLE